MRDGGWGGGRARGLLCNYEFWSIDESTVGFSFAGEDFLPGVVFFFVAKAGTEGITISANTICIHLPVDHGAYLEWGERERGVGRGGVILATYSNWGTGCSIRRTQKYLGWCNGVFKNKQQT